MQGNFLHLKNVEEARETIYRYIETHASKLIESGKDIAVKIEEYKPNRSLSANALYWMWMKEMSEHFTHKTSYSKDDMHDLMRHKFLGWDDEKRIGKTVIAATLRSTRKLNTSEMCHYMEKINGWAADNGLLLTDPIDSQYRKFLNKQES